MGFLIYTFTKKKYINLPPPDFTENSLPQNKDMVSAENLAGLIELSQTNENAFYLRFVELYPKLYNKLNSVVPKLVQSEIMFCMYLYMTYTTKEIAIYTKSSIKSIESKKYRLKKKLGISSENNLYSYIDSL